jgi:hypothetical protein
MKRSAEEWCKLTDIIVHDPDGWDRHDPNFYSNWENRQISFDEFWEKAAMSTTYGMGNKNEVWNKVLNKI